MGGDFYWTSGSSDISFIDVTLMNSGGFAYYVTSNHGPITYIRNKVTYGYPPILGGEPPLVTTSADGMHFFANQYGPTIINCLVEGTQVFVATTSNISS